MDGYSVCEAAVGEGLSSMWPASVGNESSQVGRWTSQIQDRRSSTFLAACLDADFLPKTFE
jgi:hypothetical protein